MDRGCVDRPAAARCEWRDKARFNCHSIVRMIDGTFAAQSCYWENLQLMKRPYLPIRARQWCIWIGVAAIGLGLHFEYDFRNRVQSLPAVVDEHGNTASLASVMAGLDSYQQAKNLRKLGFVSFGVGGLLCACGVLATSQKRVVVAA